MKIIQDQESGPSPCVVRVKSGEEMWRKGESVRDAKEGGSESKSKKSERERTKERGVQGRKVRWD